MYTTINIPIIIISLNDKTLYKFLKNNKDNFIIAKADTKDNKMQQFLSKYESIDIYDFSQVARDDFVKLYISLIDGLALINNNEYWWGYPTSSKNSHLSKLFNELYIFMLLINVIEKFENKNIIIINPPNSIIKSLSKYFNNKNRTVKMIGQKLFFNYHYDLFANSIFFINTAVRISFMMFRIILSKILLSPKFKKVITGNKKWYVFRSWFNNQSFPKNGIYRDQFFGELCQYLKNNGKSVLIIIGMFGVKFRNAIFAIAKIQNYPVFPIEFFLRPVDLLNAALGALKSKIKKKNLINFKDSLDISDIIQYHLNVDFSHMLFLNITHFYIAKNLARSVLIERLFLTSENNCWEKMCIQGIRDFSPSTKIVGFSHAIVSPAKLNMVLGNNEKKMMPLPDLLATNGQISRDILINTGRYDANRVTIGCALKYEKKMNSKLKSRNLQLEKIFLVALEGVNESSELANFIYNYFRKNLNHKVIIRPHPVLPLTKMRQYLTFNPDDLPGNFSISVSKKRSVMEDLLISDFLLYDGSTVSLEALAMGLPVIYVDLKRPVHDDPLFGCNYFKKMVSTEMDLQSSIEFFNTMDSHEFIKQQQLASDYIRRYFYPVNEKNLQAFLR